MLGSVWSWWRLTSASFIAAIVTGCISLGTAFVLFMILKADLAPGPFHIGIYASGMFLLVFVVCSIVLAECLRTNEQTAVRWFHVIRAVFTVAGVLLVLRLARNLYDANVPWALLTVPLYVWRAHPFLQHPYVQSSFLAKLWRYQHPPTSRAGGKATRRA